MSDWRDDGPSAAHQNLVDELNHHRRQLIQLLSKLDVQNWPRNQAIPESDARHRFDGDPATAETLLYNYRDLLAPVAEYTPDKWSEQVAVVRLPGRADTTIALSLGQLDAWRGHTVTRYRDGPGLGSQREQVTERVFLPPGPARELANQLLAVQQDLGLGIETEATRKGDVATGGHDDDTGEVDLPGDPWEDIEEDHAAD